MSSTSSAVSEASVSDLNEPECEPSRSVKSTTSAAACSPSIGQMCLAITTCENLELCRRSTWCAEAFHASHSAQLHEGDGSHTTSGLKCSVLSGSTAHATSWPKTSKKRQSPTRLETSPNLAMQRTTAVYQGLIAGRTIKEIVGGPLHTPTRKANFIAPSMQKWPSCRRFVRAFGGQRITPEQFEFLMGFPIGWTSVPPLKHSETLSSRKSQKPSVARSSRRKKQSEPAHDES